MVHCLTSSLKDTRASEAKLGGVALVRCFVLCSAIQASDTAWKQA